VAEQLIVNEYPNIVVPDGLDVLLGATSYLVKVESGALTMHPAKFGLEPEAQAIATLAILGASDASISSSTGLKLWKTKEIVGNVIDHYGVPSRYGLAQCLLEQKAWEIDAYLPTADFTRRQQDVLRLAGTGMRRKKIASILGLKPNTVRGYLHDITDKTGTTNRAQLNLLNLMMKEVTD